MAQLSRDAIIAKQPAAYRVTSDLHSGIPRGHMIDIAGIETYLIEPPKDAANGNIVLYFPDVHGLCISSQLLMDAYADAGYLTFGIDYFGRDPTWKHLNFPGDTETDPGFNFNTWLAKHRAFAEENSARWARAVTSVYARASTKVASVGSCFGAPYVLAELAQNGTSHAGGVVLLTSLQESHFYNLSKPLFLSCPESDSRFPSDFRSRAVDIMQAENKRFELQLFRGMEVDGSGSHPYARYIKEQSLRGVIEFFDFWLAHP